MAKQSGSRPRPSVARGKAVIPQSTHGTGASYAGTSGSKSPKGSRPSARVARDKMPRPGHQR